MRRASIVAGLAAALLNEPARGVRHPLASLPRRTPREEPPPPPSISEQEIAAIKSAADQRALEKAAAKRAKKLAKQARLNKSQRQRDLASISIDAIVDDTIYDHNVHQRVRRRDLHK